MKTYHLLFLAAPLLMGADSVGSRVSALSLPACADSEYLVFNKSAGGFVCQKLSGGTASVPNCAGKLLTVGGSGELRSLACTDKGSATVSQATLTKITALEDSLKTVGTKVTTIETSPVSAASYYAGATKFVTNGMITDANGNVGVTGAANKCVEEFGAGAHMCTVYELYQSVAAGKLTPQMTVATGWVYMASWSTPTASPTEPFNSLNDNCAGYTYKTADQKWTGTAFKWEPVAYNGKFAPKFNAGVACGTSMPIICCK